MTMFRNTRIRLTAWYLVIIMFISLSFSCVLYKETTREMERFARIQQLRFQRRLQHEEVIITPDMPVPEIEIEDINLVYVIKQRILITLGIVNGTILLLAGGLGYFLAGKTLRPIQEMIEEQNRFISDASHELRTPLTSLKSAMEVSLRDKNLTISDARILIAESIMETDKLQQLSEELLQLTQYQKPNGNLIMKKVSLSQIAHEAIRKMIPIAKKKQIIIKNEVQEHEIKANKEGLIDLLIILLDNAIKYSSRKSVVTLSSKESSKITSLIIQDEGIGIDKKDLPYIFDRFYRADSARVKTSTGGYGLGLAIAKKIVDIHQGSIYAERALPKGTTFIIHLPNK